MYLQTKKRTKFVKIPKFFYIEILYCLLCKLCSLCSPDFASLCRQNLGKKFLGPPLDQILDPLLLLFPCLYLVADPGFPKGGDANHKGAGANLVFGSIAPKNCMKIKKIGLAERGAHILGAPWICQWYSQITACFFFGKLKETIDVVTGCVLNINGVLFPGRCV